MMNNGWRIAKQPILHRTANRAFIKDRDLEIYAPPLDRSSSEFCSLKKIYPHFVNHLPAAKCLAFCVKISEE